MKRTNFVSLLALSFLFCINGIYGQSISSYIFGQNAWMPYSIGAAVYNGKLAQHWPDVSASKATIIRYGGISCDKNMPTNAQYLQMIDDIRANGMEPTVQVPFNNYQYTAQQAAAIVQYVNVTSGRHVKYWSIGNEPDLGYSYSTAAQIAAYIRPFASAMKAVDPNIMIIGPECSWFNSTIYDGLTNPGGPDDITGTDASGRYYVDVISFHTYPFNGSQTRAQVVSKLTSTGSLKDNLVHLNARVSAANTAHARTGANALRTAITEANIDWQNASTDNLNGVGANSFIGGQFIAEMMGVAMKSGVGILNFWSVIEGNSTALNIGYLDAVTGNKKPFYYHFQLLASNFNGNYVDGTTNNANVKSFGSQNAQNTNVLVMNEDQTNNLNFTVRLNTSAVSGTNPLKININAGIAAEYNDVIQNQSTMLLTFDPSGALVKKCVYTLANHAALNLPPACQTMSVTQNTTPTITAGNATICAGSSTVITAGGAASYTWSPGSLTGPTQTLSPSSTTVYTITGANGNASSVKTITVTVNSSPTVTANNATICKNTSTVITAGGASSYIWNPGSLSGATQTLSPAATTVYTITGSNGSCSSNKTITVTVNNPPTITAGNAGICSGGSTVVTASGAGNYIWNPGALSGASQTLNPSATTVYTITGSNGNCSSNKTVTVTVNAPPVISANNTSVCSGSTTVVSASGASNYTWNPGGLSGATQTLGPAGTTIYTITGSNGGCTSNKTITLSVVNSPTISSTSATIAAGNSTVITASGATSYTWYPGALSGASQTLNPSSTTVYTITGTNGPCVGSTTSTITVKALPTGIEIYKNNTEQISFFPNPVKAGEQVELSVTDLPFSVHLFSVNGAVVLKEEEVNSSRHFISTTNLIKGVYLISVTDSKGRKLLGKLIVN